MRGNTNFAGFDEGNYLVHDCARVCVCVCVSINQLKTLNLIILNTVDREMDGWGGKPCPLQSMVGC